jgi:hypothetical protein
MKIAKKLTVGFLVVCALVAATEAQSKLPPSTKNAALRYWLAFSELKDDRLDKDTRELLEKTAAGEVAWNEKKLANILDENLHAIQIMQKATKLPECDWGLEANTDEPVLFALKARVLARLNTLQGMSLAAKGDSEGAVGAWLAGIKFSRDLAKGGTLIFHLIARAALLSDLNALKKAGEAGTLNAKSRSMALAELSALPETGFDWGAAWEMEAELIASGWQEILKSKDSKAKYKEIMKEDLAENAKLPTPEELEAFRKFMGEVVAALRMPPAEARMRLPALRERQNTINPLIQYFIPSFERVNANREEVLIAREAAIKALSQK